MGKFLLGLIIGAVLGVLLVSYNPSLPDDVRTALASLTAMVMRGAEEAAETVGEAADEVADEAREAADREVGSPDVTPEESTAPENPDETAQPEDQPPRAE
jgi:hypothetical protein